MCILCFTQSNKNISNQDFYQYWSYNPIGYQYFLWKYNTGPTVAVNPIPFKINTDTDTVF